MAFRTPSIYGCNRIGLLSVCLLGTTIVARDLPKYEHSEYPTQLCYKCPPGYKFEGECAVCVDGSSPQWSKCAPCDNGQYQDSWNVNPRCKPRNQCISGHVDLVDDSENKLTGPVCACQSRYIEDDRGDCTQGFTKLESDEFVRIAIAKAKEEDVAKCDKRIATIQSMTSSTATATKNGTLCTTTRPDQCRENSILRWVIVFVSIFAIASFAFNIYQYCKSRRTTAREDKERDNDSLKSGVEMSNNNMEMRQRHHRKKSTSYNNVENGATNARVSSNAGLPEARRLLPEQGVETSNNNMEMRQREESTPHDNGNYQNGASNSAVSFNADSQEARPPLPEQGVETSNNNMEMRLRHHREESTPRNNGNYQNGASNSAVSFNADLQEARPLLPEQGVVTSNNNMEMRQRHHSEKSTQYDNGDCQNGSSNSGVSFNVDLRKDHAQPLLGKQGSVSRDADKREKDATAGSSLDEALRILEHRIRPHPEELDRLMRDIFEFSADKCEEIKAMSKNTESKVRCAFKKWQRKHGANAEALVRSLEKHEWNDEADEIAEALGVERIAAGAESPDELDEATKICEQMIENKDAIRFVRCLGVEFDCLKMSGVEIIRKGVWLWRQKRASKATVRELVKILRDAEFVDVADEISDNLQAPSDKVFIVHETSRPQEDKAAPTYNPQEQLDDQPVREMAQPTVDAEAQSAMSRPISHSEAASAYVDDRSVSQTTIPKTFFPVPPAMPTADDVNEDDSFAIKLDDEDNSKTIMDVDFIDERNAGDGKEPPNQSSKKQS